jgi:hypothetical protein
LAKIGTFAKTAIINYHARKNFRFMFPFAANIRKFAVSVFCLQQTNGSCRFPLVPRKARICHMMYKKT